MALGGRRARANGLWPGRQRWGTRRTAAACGAGARGRKWCAARLVSMRVWNRDRRRGIAAAFACDGEQGVAALARRRAAGRAGAGGGAQHHRACRTGKATSTSTSRSRPANHASDRAGMSEPEDRGFVRGSRGVVVRIHRRPAGSRPVLHQQSLLRRAARRGRRNSLCAWRPSFCASRSNGADAALPETIDLVAVDVREVSVPADGEPVHWRLLTTHPVTSLGRGTPYRRPLSYALDHRRVLPHPQDRRLRHRGGRYRRARGP